MQSDVLQLESASLYRDDQLIFNDISFELKSGDHLIIKGNNGSGKTSLIRTPISYTRLRAHETRHEIVCRLLLEKKKYILLLQLA